MLSYVPGNLVGVDISEGLIVMRILVLRSLLLIASSPVAADYTGPAQADYILRDFRFMSGETLPELRNHYRTLGTPRRGEDGKVNNAVLILHGTTGSGPNLFRPEFAGNSSARANPSTRPASS